MIIDRYRKLVDRLYDKTMQGNLTWELANENGFYINIGGGTVKIWSRPTDLGDQDYYITIYDKEGNMSDQFADTEVDEGVRGTDGKLIYYAKLHEMYLTIRRQIRGSDVLLNSIIDELD